MNLPGFTADSSIHRDTAHYVCGELPPEATTPADSQVIPQLSIPIYGNWCGPGHGGGPAIDAVDAVCRAHDRCYGSRGYFNCRCDREGLRNMPSAIARTPNPRAAAGGAAFIAWFSQAPCSCRRRVCYPSGIRWCTRRVWGRRVRYPCGTRTACRTITVPGGRGGLGAC